VKTISQLSGHSVSRIDEDGNYEETDTEDEDEEAEGTDAEETGGHSD
jgi:hypothetical protein